MRTDNFIDILALLFVILWSGGGFTYGLFSYWPVALLPIALIIILYRKIQFHKGLYFIFVVILFRIVQQIIYSGGIASIVAASASIITLFFIFRIIEQNFADNFVNIVTFFALISLLFWAVDVTPVGHKLLLKVSYSMPQMGFNNLGKIDDISYHIDHPQNLFFYSVNDRISDHLPRNSGPFWEPGRFTIFITIALLIQLYFKREVVLSKKNLILLFANITTFSTTGYIAMAFLFVGLILDKYKVSFRTIFYSILLVLLVGYVSQLDFMQDKITMQMQSDASRSRFGAILYHIPMILNSPFIGYGDRLSYVYGAIDMSPNGWTDLLLHWGIPFTIIWLVFLFKGVKYYAARSVMTQIFAFVVILTLSFAQTIMSSPFFVILYYFAFSDSNQQYKQYDYGT